MLDILTLKNLIRLDNFEKRKNSKVLINKGFRAYLKLKIINEIKNTSVLILK